MSPFNWLWILGSVVLWFALRPFSRLLTATLFGRAVGAAALAQQPDTIHLEPASPDAWRDAENARRVSDALRALGFEETGTFRIPELPGVTLKLLAHAGESMYAAVYEHPVAGAWFELFMRYQDGTSATFSTHRPTGLNDRPGHPIVNLVGADPRTLFEQAKRGRTQGALARARAADAVHTFESGYAEAMAWRKAQGISRGEVIKVARRAA